jgi:hypothetical protein
MANERRKSIPLQLKTEAEEARRETCRRCRWAVPGPPPYQGRKFYCARLWDTTHDQRQRAYLPRLVADPREECPLSFWSRAGPDDLLERGDRVTLAPIYRQLWAELHTHREPSTSWWEDFVRRVPCHLCRAHARQFAARSPVPLDPDAFFEWGVALHNSVSAKLKRPTMWVDEAREAWALWAAGNAVAKAETGVDRGRTS